MTAMGVTSDVSGMSAVFPLYLRTRTSPDAIGRWLGVLATRNPAETPKRSPEVHDGYRSAQLHPTGRHGIGPDRGWKSPTHGALASVPYGRAFGVLVLSFAGHCS